ncbi:hypothetical protein NHX12_015138 [Muraenolepis orangiensis]|uniref:Uncharacterized protein n=1 Tax=Muraenolepis orangiensis TaxID=630683 RepID=A0A9Q0DBM3_9TELE|nr:hypothetical protein NHX12_015138 [Muraenolepis orangiensis]
MRSVLAAANVMLSDWEKNAGSTMDSTVDSIVDSTVDSTLDSTMDSTTDSSMDSSMDSTMAVHDGFHLKPAGASISANPVPY